MTWTVISLVITFISLTGYSYLNHLPGNEVFLDQLVGQHLIFKVLSLGIGFFFLTYLIVTTLSLLAFLALELTSIHLIPLKSLIYQSTTNNYLTSAISTTANVFKLAYMYLRTNIDGFSYVVSHWQIAISMPLSTILAIITAKNKDKKIKEDPKVYVKHLKMLVQKHYGQLDEYIFDIAERIVETMASKDPNISGPLILFTLSSRKVYIGYPIDFNIYQKEDCIKILPVISGFRHETNLTMELTTFYEEVYDLLLNDEVENEHNGTEIDFVTLIPVGEIISISSFDPKAYRHFNEDGHRKIITESSLQLEK